MSKKIEPLKLEAYRCPIVGCGETIFGSYEDAVKHVNQPIGPRLPIGLLFGRREECYTIVTGESEGLSPRHSPFYSVKTFEGSSQFKLLLEGETSGESMVMSIAGGFYARLLPLEEFKKVSGALSKLAVFANSRIVPVRSTRELELILRGRK